jgi:hypothetical protein
MSKRAKRPMTRAQIEALGVGNPLVAERLAEGRYADRIGSGPDAWEGSGESRSGPSRFPLLQASWLLSGFGEYIDWSALNASSAREERLTEEIVSALDEFRREKGRWPLVPELYDALGWPEGHYNAMSVFKRLLAGLLIEAVVGLNHIDAGLKGQLPSVYLRA